MKRTKTNTLIIIIIITIILVSASYIGYTQFFTSSEYATKIISMDLTKSETSNNFTISTTLKNIGKNDINNAELHILIIKDNDIIESKVQTFSLNNNQESTFTNDFIDITFKTGDLYKLIASVYLQNENLDSQTITKQF